MTEEKSSTNYIVATVRPWNVAAFEKIKNKLPGRWHLITKREELTQELIERLQPRYLFFPHWSWKVPANILIGTECVCFHMSDVPYGRGGSPLQNLIVRGHRTTKLTALRMVNELDAGPVYLKRDLDLSDRAEDVFTRAAENSYSMIDYIVRNEPKPEPQVGPPTVFSRRTPEMSRLPKDANLEALYDHIRMLDAETYPLAFIEYGNVKLSLNHAEFDESGCLVARVRITQLEEG